MKYIRESIGFTPKNLKKNFCLKMFFTDKKSYNVKKALKNFRLSRAAAAVDKNGQNFEIQVPKGSHLKEVFRDSAV
jgi:hypothetical protein